MGVLLAQREEGQEQERLRERGRPRDGGERERENKIVQLHSKHYFSFFNKRFHGVVDARQVQLSATNVSITLLQSAAQL